MTKAAYNVCILLVSGALSASGLLAQSTSNQSITGTVSDATGAVVANATVMVTNTGQNFSRTATTGSTGNFTISNIPIGRYNISASAAGFKKYLLTNQELVVDQNLTVNLRLEVGALTDSITVQADAAHVETQTGEVGRLISGQESTQLQLNGRNYPQLLSLLPGVSTTYSSGFGLFGGYGVNNSAQSVNGGREDTFSWNLDGADNKDNGGGGNNFVNINPDAIAEFTMLTTNYSAEYGNSSGAVVNIALKSGTKDFHGIAYEYFRNDDIQARAFNATSKPELRFNNFGWNVGGPIYIPKLFNRNREKLFFFIGEDFKRLRQGATNTWEVPTQAEIAGNFSALPASQWPKNPATGVVYPGGIIPASAINTNSQRLLENYPAPNFNGAGGNYVFNDVSPLNTNEYIYKVDYNISSRNQISGHYTRDYYTSQQDQTQLIEYNRDIPGTNAAIQWTFVANPTTVNVLTGAFTGNVIIENTGIIPNPLFISDYTRAGEGFNAPSLYNASNAIPTIAIAGFTTLTATPLNFNNFNRVFDAKDDFSKVLGNHTLRAGIDAKRSRKNQNNVPAINGSFSFATSNINTSGNALADAVLGNFYTYSEASAIEQGWYRFTQIEPYVQDDWKVNSRLTVNLGFRYQYMPPEYSALNNTTAFLPQYYIAADAPTINPKTGYITSDPYPYNGLVLSGNGFPATAVGRVNGTSNPAVTALFHDFPLGGARTDWNTWAPRVGFAYDLTGKQSTVLRGGFGVFYERIEGNFLFSAVNNPPFIQSSTIYYGNVNNPGGGSAANAPNAINNSHYLDMKVPRVLNWSLGIQQKLGRDSTVEATYVGSSAANLSYQDDINQLQAGTIQANPGVNVNALRPYLGYADIYEYNTGANFIYNSLQMQYKKQFPGAGIITAAFTWESARTDANAYNYQPENSYNLRGDWGPSSYNRREVLVISYVYPLPFWRHGDQLYKKLLGGWQISGVTTLNSGLPQNITLASDIAGAGAGSERPNLVGNPRAGVSGTQFLNPAAFAVPAAGTYGNLGAYAITGPGTNNWDASLQKSFPIGEHVKADFRAELYDFPNHLSYFSINTGSFSATPPANFGQVSAATDPRTVQFALRLSF
jgi:roadblock/LC7 domain-containing protein